MRIHVSLVPILLGNGVRSSRTQGDRQLGLEFTRVVESDGLTHPRYRVVK
jgi:hypothetical protein